MGLWEELYIGARVILAVVVKPRKCLRCDGKRLDVLPPMTPGSIVLDAVGFRVVRCHDCQQAFVTWGLR